MNLAIVNMKDLNEKDKEKVDEFILDKASTGEFINTIKYLSYHPENRFIDDSIVIKDTKNDEIKTVIMAGYTAKHKDTIISHPGTTFSGPIFKYTQGFAEIESTLELALKYYEEKYSEIVFRTQPSIYATQPVDDVPYILVKNGFESNYTALSNVINLSTIKDEEELMKMYSSRRRNHIRNFMKGTEYEFLIKDKVEEEVWKSINQNLKEKHHVSSTHSYCEINDLKNKMPEYVVPYKIEKSDGQYGALGLIYKFKNVFHAQYIGFNNNLMKEYPNILLIHDLIKEAMNEGYEYFSFGASTEHNGEYLNEGLYNFKKSFGGGRIIQPLYRKTLK